MTRSEAERALLALIRKAGLAGNRVIRVRHRQLARRPEKLVARFATGLAAAR